MNVIGIIGAFYWDANESEKWVHDSGATLFLNGKHICSISEERLTKVKYDGNYPARSISYCLDVGNILPKDIDLVCVSSISIGDFYDHLKHGIIHKKLQDIFINAKIEIVGHHKCHAASAVFSSPFNQGTFLTMDGAGSGYVNYEEQWVSTEVSSIGYFDKSKNIFRTFSLFDSGQWQTATNHYWNAAHKTYNLKTDKNIDIFDSKHREAFCGKIMGLSAYGSWENYDWKRYKVLNKDTIPTLLFDNSYDYICWDISPEDMAAITQKNTEEGVLELVTELRKEYLDEYTCFAGGLFLNILTNTRIKNSGIFKDIYIPPYPSDCGLHFGAACYGLFRHNETITLPDNVALLGREYSEEEIFEEVKDLKYQKYDDFTQLCRDTSQLLYDNKIIGWFQGRSEHGPRALGSRSILMNPAKREHKDIINERIKHREYWRPFAGIILDEYLEEYFVDNIENPYMIYSQTVRPEKKQELAAIIHEDDTCRIQTVNDKMNDKVSCLLREYHSISGTPVLLNTSFNDNGQPIVETPRDAVEAFLNLDLEYLVIGNYLIYKEGS